MDDQLIDAIKHLASDPVADTKVKKKLLSILASWSTQFKNDPSLSTIAGLYRRSHGRSESADPHFLYSTGVFPHKAAAKKQAKHEKEDSKERARKADEEARQKKNRSRRGPFNFEAVSITPISSRRTPHIVLRRNPKY